MRHYWIFYFSECYNSIYAIIECKCKEIWDRKIRWRELLLMKLQKVFNWRLSLADCMEFHGWPNVAKRLEIAYESGNIKWVFLSLNTMLYFREMHPESSGLFRECFKAPTKWLLQQVARRICHPLFIGTS